MKSQKKLKNKSQIATVFILIFIFTSCVYLFSTIIKSNQIHNLQFNNNLNNNLVDTQELLIDKTDQEINSEIIQSLEKKYGTGAKKVALTFDDGPATTTLKILEILKRQNVKATFFDVGKYMLQYPEILQMEIDQGHVVGNHSYNHSKFLATMDPNLMLKNINSTQNIIDKVTSQKTKLFRPPYGNLSPKMEKVLLGAGYKIILWNVDPRDWDVKNNPKIIESQVLNHVFDNAIVLLHDGKSVYTGSESKKITNQNTEEILEDMIIKLKTEGYEFVTLDNM